MLDKANNFIRNKKFTFIIFFDTKKTHQKMMSFNYSYV